MSKSGTREICVDFLQWVEVNGISKYNIETQYYYKISRLDDRASVFKKHFWNAENTL